ncbi:MAG: TatD family hydrolase [Prevotella sp.]|nr:TatD family hydrolase [Prevotella sp.]
MLNIIDTHAHIDGQEYDADRLAVIERARQAGVSAIFVPAIDLASTQAVMALCQQHPGYLYPMAGLHPEEVKADWPQQLDAIHHIIEAQAEGGPSPLIAIGEVGLDYYWSREFEKEQLEAFEQQVQWSVQTQLPLMIHCRKAQNEMVRLLRHYERELPGGVFHCFTGNDHEALELLQFDRFVLGIGGVLTFKKSHLPETLAACVPLDRIVLETDAPYMAPVPLRGQRNESAFTIHVLQRLAEAYGLPAADVARQTTATARRVFGLA